MILLFKNKLFSAILLAIVFCYSPLSNAAIKILAAENFYGEVAKQLGGDYVDVENIISSPNQDPHLFTLTPHTVKHIHAADIVVYNGADYDPWINPVLSVDKNLNQHLIEVASLMHTQSGDNPHIWYKPKTMLIYAKTMTALLSKIDPEQAPYFQTQLNRWMRDYQAIDTIINRIQTHYPGTPVIATEPLFNYMAERLGFHMNGIDFQINTMNDVAPSMAQIKDFENHLRHHSVKLLIYNLQVDNRMTKRLLAIAKENAIPILGITETLPLGMTFIEWMTTQLIELETLLKQAGK